TQAGARVRADRCGPQAADIIDRLTALPRRHGPMAELDWYIRNELRLRHLHLLVVLDDLRSMGKVAAHIHVTQPAVSKALGEMEKGLGAKLFERTSRGILPTV